MMAAADRRVLFAAVRFGWWTACATVSTVAACGSAFVGDHWWAVYFTVAALCSVPLARIALNAWRGRRLAAMVRTASSRMLAAEMCVPPGHMWRTPAGEPSRPGWCLCGEMYRDQSECDALNSWRCEP